jgi:hypothetical protein
MRLWPPRRWKRIGIRTTSVALLPQFAYQAREALGPDSHFDRVLLHVHPFEQLAPDRGEVGEQFRDLTR